jgi:hypothetical protein
MLPGPLNLRLLVLSMLLKESVVSVIGDPLYSFNRLIEGNAVINRVEKLCYRLLPNEDWGQCVSWLVRQRSGRMECRLARRCS